MYILMHLVQIKSYVEKKLFMMTELCWKSYKEVFTEMFMNICYLAFNILTNNVLTWSDIHDLWFLVSTSTKHLHCVNSMLVSRAVTRSSLEREVWGSNLGPVKSDTGLPTARHRCDISPKRAVLPGRNDVEIGPSKLVTCFGVLQRAWWKIKFENILFTTSSVLQLRDLEKLKISLLEFFVTKMQLESTIICVYFITVLLSASFTLCRCLQKKIP